MVKDRAKAGEHSLLFLKGASSILSMLGSRCRRFRRIPSTAQVLTVDGYRERWHHKTPDVIVSFDSKGVGSGGTDTRTAGSTMTLKRTE